MAIFRKVHTEFWRDPKVLEELTPEGKLLFLYTLTNPNTTQIGIYKITKKQMAFELGFSTESINALMDIFENKYKLIKYNKETRELAIKHWGKYNLDRGGKPIIDCIKKELKYVKDKSLIHYVSENIERQELKVLFDNVYNDTSYESSPNCVQEKEKEKEEEKDKEEELNKLKNCKASTKNGDEKNYERFTNKYSKSEYAKSLKGEDESIYKKPSSQQLEKVRRMLQG